MQFQVLRGEVESAALLRRRRRIHRRKRADWCLRAQAEQQKINGRSAQFL
jgi:hypothetical protein